MKVGICTFHNVDNYGAVLQTLGSVLILRELGHSPVVVDYFPAEFEVSGGSLIKKIGLENGTFHRKVCELCSYEGVRNSIRLRSKDGESDESSQYQSFRQLHLPLSPRLDERSVWKYLETFDGLYVGSDQVWRKFMTEKNYFLLDNCAGPRKVSYAASFGILPRQEFVPGLLRRALRNFSSVGIRDRFSKNYLAECGVDGTLVVDPTILVDFDGFESKPQNFPESIEEKPFILVYALDRWQGGLGNKVVRMLKKKLCLPVLSIRRGNWYGGDADYSLADVGPAEWLWLFKHSSFVCTDSFHGSIFSLKNKKPFVTYFEPGYYRAARLIDMRQQLNLQNIIDCPELPRKEPDYDSARAILDKQKEISIDFLKSAFS